MDTPEFDIGGLDAQDEASLEIKHPKTEAPTGWIWTFYGPAHPITIALANKVAAEQLVEARAKEQARVNGKKWKADDESYDALLAKSIDSMVRRTKGFTPIKLDGELIEFSVENARKLLADRRKGWLVSQVREYLKEDESFIQPSAKS